MKQLWLLIMCVGVSVSLHAQQQVKQSLKVSPDSRIDIQHLNGRADIKGWDKDEVKVEGELGDRTEEFIFERRGNQVYIKVRVERGRNWYQKNSSKDNLEIHVPRQASVSYKSTNAKMSVADVQGGTRAELINGELRAKNLAGRVSLEAVNGDIQTNGFNTDRLRIETVNGDIQDRNSSSKVVILDSVNGDIESNNTSRDVSVETVNGSMNLTLSAIDDLQLSTVNGHIEATLSLADDASVQASSVGGAIDMYFAQSVSARFDIQGHAGGRIVNKLSDHQPSKAKYGPRRSLEFSLNGGKAEVELSTVSGRIRLNQQ